MKKLLLTAAIATILFTGHAHADICNVHIPHVIESVVIEVPFKPSRSKQGTLRIEPDNKIQAAKDPLDLPPNEMKNLIRGLIWRDEHFSGQTLSKIAEREQITPRYISHLIEKTFTII